MKLIIFHILLTLNCFLLWEIIESYSTESLFTQQIAMSLGFLTESALIPKKSKEVKIDPSIVFVVILLTLFIDISNVQVVGLKTLVADEEQKTSNQKTKGKYIRRV